MPVISVFFGIVIRMFHREHGVAHFQVEYQGQQATFTFDGDELAGRLESRTARRLIKEWATTRRRELEANWPPCRRASRWSGLRPWSREATRCSFPV